jgi:hypothetical protein
VTPPDLDSLQPSGRADKPSNRPATVGPETTRITPIITAAPGDMPGISAAAAAASGQVISTPMMVSLTTMGS